jgi:hypothetical protein
MDTGRRRKGCGRGLVKSYHSDPLRDDFGGAEDLAACVVDFEEAAQKQGLVRGRAVKPPEL